MCVPKTLGSRGARVVRLPSQEAGTVGGQNKVVGGPVSRWPGICNSVQSGGSRDRGRAADFKSGVDGASSVNAQSVGIGSESGSADSRRGVGDGEGKAGRGDGGVSV